jgi:hypothetical protein
LGIGAIDRWLSGGYDGHMLKLLLFCIFMVASIIFVALSETGIISKAQFPVEFVYILIGPLAFFLAWWAFRRRFERTMNASISSEPWETWGEAAKKQIDEKHEES